MAQKQYKRLFRLWTIADFEAEEVWLRKQHNLGWKFVKYTLPGFYLFEACTPEDVIYQLDFNDLSKVEKSSYLQLFSDYEWEYLQTVNGFSYFRKPAIFHREEDLTIFSDTESKIEMIQKLTRRRLLPLVAVFMGCILPQLYTQSHEYDVVGRILYATFIILFVLYLILFLHIMCIFTKLKKKYGKEK